MVQCRILVNNLKLFMDKICNSLASKGPIRNGNRHMTSKRAHLPTASSPESTVLIYFKRQKWQTHLALVLQLQRPSINIILLPIESQWPRSQILLYKVAESSSNSRVTPSLPQKPIFHKRTCSSRATRPPGSLWLSTSSSREMICDRNVWQVSFNRASRKTCMNRRDKLSLTQ